MATENYLFIEAIQKKPVTRTPIWIMRQAGRYLPEYMDIRKKHDFMTVCKTPELATEVTLQPIRRFGFDAAILFSDILVIPEALGQKLEFLENHGPKLSPEIRRAEDISALSIEGIEEKLSYVAKAVTMIRSGLDNKTPLIGFSGSPLTLATYMIEGKPTRNFKYIKRMLFSAPDQLTRLLEILTEAVTRYLVMQIKAGAQTVQIFDTWGGILPVHLFDAFSGRFMKQIVSALKPYNVPVILFSKGGMEILQLLKDSEANMLGVDWMTDMAAAKESLGNSFALQGNLDPTVLYGSKEIITHEVENVLRVFGSDSGHVFNLGHGILPDIPVINVYHLVETVREISTKLHAEK